MTPSNPLQYAQGRVQKGTRGIVCECHTPNRWKVLCTSGGGGGRFWSSKQEEQKKMGWIIESLPVERNPFMPFCVLQGWVVHGKSKMAFGAPRFSLENLADVVCKTEWVGCS